MLPVLEAMPCRCSGGSASHRASTRVRLCMGSDVPQPCSKQLCRSRLLLAHSTLASTYPARSNKQANSATVCPVPCRVSCPHGEIVAKGSTWYRQGQSNDFLKPRATPAWKPGCTGKLRALQHSPHKSDVERKSHEPSAHHELFLPSLNRSRSPWLLNISLKMSRYICVLLHSSSS